tara:strand:- start:36656 stop:37039 length:384 start_codon:yes stop_codon:yes gene_type:complete
VILAFHFSLCHAGIELNTVLLQYQSRVVCDLGSGNDLCLETASTGCLTVSRRPHAEDTFAQNNLSASKAKQLAKLRPLLIASREKHHLPGSEETNIPTFPIIAQYGAVAYVHVLFSSEATCGDISLE